MKNFNYQIFRNVIAFLILFLVFVANDHLSAAGEPIQTPQFYNSNSTLILTISPLGIDSGSEAQWLIKAGEFINPSHATNGYISSIYFITGDIETCTFSNLMIKLGKTTLTSLPIDQIYTGPMDTVYFRSSVTLTSGIGTWMQFLLDKPFLYDTSQSLVIDVKQCGFTGAYSMNLGHSISTDNRRTYLTTVSRNQCRTVFAGQDAFEVDFGFDLMVETLYPPYFNFYGGNDSDPDPFGQTAGQRVNWLISSFNCPSPAPSGFITTLYFKMSGYDTATYTNLTIKLGLTKDTLLPESWYSGPMDTVYFRPSVILGALPWGWIRLDLDKPEYFDNSQHLVVDVQQCGSTNSLFVHENHAGSSTRNYGTPSSCPVIYAGQDSHIMNTGININPVIGIPHVPNNTIPANYSLEQNYPNPFNPSTDITFSIAKAGLVQLTVYDILGREIDVLAKQSYQPGKYTVSFDASRLASGVYFYTLRVNDFTATKKMMLIK